MEVKEASGDENDSPERRMISNAAVRRIARRRGKAGSGLSRTRSSKLRGKSFVAGEEEDDDDDDSADEGDDYDEDGSPKKALARTVTRNTSNHYTLNMPSPAPMKGDAPYVLLG